MEKMDIIFMRYKQLLSTFVIALTILIFLSKIFVIYFSIIDKF